MRMAFKLECETQLVNQLSERDTEHDGRMSRRDSQIPLPIRRTRFRGDSANAVESLRDDDSWRRRPRSTYAARSWAGKQRAECVSPQRRPAEFRRQCDDHREYRQRYTFATHARAREKVSRVHVDDHRHDIRGWRWRIGAFDGHSDTRRVIHRGRCAVTTIPTERRCGRRIAVTPNGLDARLPEHPRECRGASTWRIGSWRIARSGEANRD